MTDRTLFDVDRTTTKPCGVLGCSAVRLPGQANVVECMADLARIAGDWERRPKGCLNAHDPAHAPFPEGF